MTSASVVPLVIALIMFTLAQVGTLACAVLYFRSESASTRREVETLREEVKAGRAADAQLVQVQLQNVAAGLTRVERQITDVAHALNTNRRATDPPFIVTPE